MMEIRALQKRFGNFRLGELSLRIGTGEYWVILGPSGAGKSMLLHTLAGFHAPDAGHLLAGKEDITETPPESRKIGLVLQRSALFDHLSVRANVEFGLRVRGQPPAERSRQADSIMQSLNIMDLLDHPVSTLSGGEAQKVALARALAIKPNWLLLDEPLGPIDHHTRLHLQNELKRIHQEYELTTVHVTHSREEARALGDHCAIMVAGQIIQSGPTDDVFENPMNDFVADFLGRSGSPH